VNPNEYDWQMGSLADPYLAPDERRMQPPPQDAPWPQQALASPGDPASWKPEPTRLARWPYEPPPVTGTNLEQQSSIDAADAAAYQTKSRYRNALARDPESNKMGALAELAGAADAARLRPAGVRPVACGVGAGAGGDLRRSRRARPD
jgi:hypothetical protein